MISSNIALGADIGGSHISCMACDLDHHRVVESTFVKVGVNNQGASDQVILSWCSAIKQSAERSVAARIKGIGIAVPGPFDYLTGTALYKGDNAKYENLNGIDIPSRIRAELGPELEVPIRFINDAAAFAIAEDRVGKAQAYDRSLSITIGTGLGSTFVRDGLPMVTGIGVPPKGCLWHLPFKAGIADDYFSTRGLLSSYYNKSGNRLNDVKQLAQLAGDDLLARQTFEQMGEELSDFLSPWIKQLATQVLVIGGNISRAFPLFGPALVKKFEKDKLDVQVNVSDLKEKASIIGATLLIDEVYYNRIAPALEAMS